MAVAVMMDFEGATLDQYDEVMALLGLAEAEIGPEGAHFHWVAPTETGIRVVDVWESAEQFQKFADEQIGPSTQQVGIPNPPEVTMHEVHNTLAGPG